LTVSDEFFLSQLFAPISQIPDTFGLFGLFLDDLHGRCYGRQAVFIP
jgi:hypothetical protein